MEIAPFVKAAATHTGKSIISYSIPWSPTPSLDEQLYRAAGLIRTTGTVFRLPPSKCSLIEAFTRPHKGTLLTVGARALSKHYERKAKDASHPYWVSLKGSEADKSEQAEQVVRQVLQDAEWKNVHRLNRETVVYEVRTREGWGARWTLLNKEHQMIDTELEECTFRGFVEPQEGYKEFMTWG
ncbi:hypothetical protein HDU85_004257 [Gaertneriomyces sp. JEL0708]|nr:hypothetical protein HDU85_004257 [Gaertneriomyces sp. JEL0708]